MNFAKLSVQAQRFATDNSPLILTAIGAAGSVLAVFQASRASLRAAEMIQNEQFKINVTDTTRHQMTKKEKVHLVWKEYVLPGTTLLGTVTAIVYANRISTRRLAALAAAYSLADKNYEEYKEKIVQKLGPNKEQAARDELAQDRVNRNPPTESQVIMVGGGDILCIDQFTGRYFKSDMESIRKAENDTNYQILRDGYASLSDFYERVGLAATSFSEEVGWKDDQKVDLKFSSVISPDGKPCISFDFDATPIRNYAKCWAD